MDFRNTTLQANSPLVTIGILSYNYSQYIEDTLNSLLLQTHKNIELIITDDCSTDNSVSIIKEWVKKNNVKCLLFVEKNNEGIPKCCNTIIKHSTGKYLVLFASDDIMNPERIEKQVNEMEAVGSEYAFCFSNVELMNEIGEDRGLFYKSDKLTGIHEGNTFRNYLVKNFRIPSPSLLFRKEIFNKIGLYDERLSTEDIDMYLRILPYHKIKYCNYIGVKYRIKENKKFEENTLQAIVNKYNNDRIIIYLKLYKLIGNSKEWSDLKPFIIKKINFHLIQLSLFKSTFFKRGLFHLFKNGFFKISYKYLLALEFNGKKKRNLDNSL